MKKIKKNNLIIKDINYYIIFGFCIYLLLLFIDRFVCKIPDYVYIAVSTIGMLLILIGIIKDKKRR